MKRPRKPTLAETTDKLRKARAAIKAMQTISTATTDKIRLEYISAIADTALEMTK